MRQVTLLVEGARTAVAHHQLFFFFFFFLSLTFTDATHIVVFLILLPRQTGHQLCYTYTLDLRGEGPSFSETYIHICTVAVRDRHKVCTSLLRQKMNAE